MLFCIASSFRAGDLHIHTFHCLMKSAKGVFPFFLLEGRQSRRNVSRGATTRTTSHYYDVLGLTPNATQNQIKTAYYNMSKLHHPDVTECKNSHSLFTEISEAYEVLGNIRKRRMYDKGVYRPQHMSHTQREDTSSSENYNEDYTNRYRENNFQRGQRPPPPRGRTKIYNFDEFYRQHYNDVRERRAEEYQEFLRHQETLRQYRKKQTDGLPFSLILGFWMAILFGSFLFHENHDVDKVSMRKQNKMQNGTNDPLKFINEKD